MHPAIWNRLPIRGSFGHFHLLHCTRRANEPRHHHFEWPACRLLVTLVCDSLISSALARSFGSTCTVTTICGSSTRRAGNSIKDLPILKRSRAFTSQGISRFRDGTHAIVAVVFVRMASCHRIVQSWWPASFQAANEKSLRKGISKAGRNPDLALRVHGKAFSLDQTKG
jgi:hypothetical protein